MENDPYVGWVYHLDKTQLRNELLKYDLDPEGKLDKVRKRFVAHLRSDNLTTSDRGEENENNRMDYAVALGGNTVYHTHSVLSRNEQNESVALREILGLPPNANSRTLRAMILSLKTLENPSLQLMARWQLRTQTKRLRLARTALKRRNPLKGRTKWVAPFMARRTIHKDERQKPKLPNLMYNVRNVTLRRLAELASHNSDFFWISAEQEKPGKQDTQRNRNLWCNTFSALIDTGATISMLGKRLAEHLRRNGNIPFKRPMKIRMADGPQTLLEEYYSFEGLICNIDTTHTFEALCVPSLTSDLIVGVDSIESLGLLKYDFPPQTRPGGNIFLKKSDVGDVSGLNQLSEDEQEVLEKFLREELPKFNDVRGNV
ncbi:hypothetical protein J6590_077348 [Homalodisca vitripennis]|nr:hypothetical protein J6590_077348 [Homalodisca vitripennis]